MQETGRERGSVLVALPLSRRSPAARLSIGALGLTLVLMVSAAWATGVVYLQARLGLGWPLRPALVDGAHAYVGVVGGVFVAAKVARVGLRHRVRGVPSVVPWQRWVSWSLLVLYGAVFVSGVLLFLPIRGARTTTSSTCTSWPRSGPSCPPPGTSGTTGAGRSPT